MKLNSYLVKNRLGTFYIRLQRNGLDKRISLRTKNKSEAIIAALHFNAQINMTRRTLGWGCDTRSDGTFSFTTDENDKADNFQSAERALEIIAKNYAQPKLVPQQAQQIQPIEDEHPVKKVTKNINVIEAIAEYIPYLSGKEKTVKQSTSTLNELVKMLGENFNMRFFDNDLVKHFWLDPKLEQTLTGAKNPKKASTIKREFSPILGFSRWATDKKYCPAPLTLTVKRGESEHYDYFKSDDLKIIFDKLVTEATQDWHIWIPAISLFTGGRIGEIAELKTEHFFNKAELEIMHLPGTKNDCAPRDVPIHNDLIDMGLLKHVENRRKLKKEYLFNISNESENGRGGTASKAFGYFKRAKCGITQKTKSHHSFRHTIIDHLKQHESNPEIRRQFMGHAQSKDVHDTVYGRQGFALAALKREVNDKIDWQKYCNWTPNLEALGKAAAELTGANKAKETRPTITRRSPKKLSQT